MKSLMRWTGKVIVQIGDRRYESNNLVVASGRQLFAQRIGNIASTAPTHIAVGTGSTVVADGDTTLATELTRVACSTITASAGVTTFPATFPAGVGTGTLREIGLFNASSSGTMAARAVFADPIVKLASDEALISWVITGSSI